MTSRPNLLPSVRSPFSACSAVKWLLTLGAVGLGSAPPASAQSEPPIQIEHLRVGLSERAPVYKVGTWTPLWVTLQAGAERFTGVLEVVAPDDDGTPTSYHRRVDVPARQTVVVPSYTRPGSRASEITLRVYDPNGRRRAELVSSAMRDEPVGLLPEETLVASLGNPAGVEQIPNVPGFSPRLGSPMAAELGGLVVAPIRLPDGLPGRWYGFDALEAIVLDANDRQVMAALGGGRGEPLREWVRQGGHLVVAVSSNWQQVRDSLLDPMLPAVLAGQVPVSDLGALDSFAGLINPIRADAPVLAARLEQLDQRGGTALVTTVDTPLVVRGTYGFGRVTLVGLDVDQRPFADWEDRAPFWVRAIDLRRPSVEGALSRGMAGPGRMVRTDVSDYATALRKALGQFEGVRLVPFGWVAFFIFLYILLIGPGDYLFLKRVVKRMELTWLTFPAIVLTVSLAAYAAAYAIKGTELKVNKVDVLDVDQTTGQARGSAFWTVFSPQNRDFNVSLVPLPMDRDPGNDAAIETDPASSRRRPAGSTMLVSWLGVPEDSFGGMNRPSRIGLTGGHYRYEPMGEAEALHRVRIPIWTTKSFAARWTTDSPALVESDLRLVGSDRVGGTVTNRLPSPLRRAALAFGEQLYELGDIAPGATVRVVPNNNRRLSGYLSSLAVPYLGRYNWDHAQSQAARPDLVRVVMFHDAATGEAATIASNPLRYLDLSGQVLLNRPMLIADYDAPASALHLGNAPRTPVVEQTTVLRVALPLDTSRDR